MWSALGGVKQLIGMEPRKCNQNVFQFQCKWFLQLLLSFCLGPVLCMPHCWKGGISACPSYASGGGYTAFIHIHADLSRGSGWLCLTSVWLPLLLGAALLPGLSFWFSLWLDAFAVYFPKAAWQLSWCVLWNFSSWQTILQFDVV